jgi:hypothetical protein
MIALARYDILFLAHDYVGVGPGWYEGWVKYGLQWDWIVPAGVHRMEGDVLRRNRLFYNYDVDDIARYIGRGVLETQNTTDPITPWNHTKPWIPVAPWNHGFPFGRYIRQIEPVLAKIKKFCIGFTYVPPDLDLERPASAAAYSSGELFILKTAAARAVPPLIDIDHTKPDDMIYSLILASRFSFRVNPHVTARWFKPKGGPSGGEPSDQLITFLIDNGLATKAKQ